MEEADNSRTFTVFLRNPPNNISFIFIISQRFEKSKDGQKVAAPIPPFGAAISNNYVSGSLLQNYLRDISLRFVLYRELKGIG